MKKTIGKVLSILIVMSILLSSMSFMAFAAETYDNLVVDGVGTVYLTEDIPAVTLKFTPTQTGFYVITSDNGDSEDIDPRVYVLDSEFNTIADDDDGAGNLNFACSFSAEAGETYYVEFTSYNESAAEYNYYVRMIEVPQSISVEVSRELQENMDGCYTTDSLYDEDNNYIGESEEYFSYFIEDLLTYTVTLADGSVVTGTREEIGEATGMYPEIWTGQSYDNPWGPGVHTAECWLYYASEEYISCEFEIEILANPVSSISAVGTKGLIEGYSGRWTNDYNEETGEYDLKYYEYGPWNAYLIYTIVYNGETYTGDESYICDIVGGDVWVSYSSDQSYDNQWGVGAHEFTIYFSGAKGTAAVEVIENPVERVDAVVNQDLIEGYDGYWHADEYWDEELEEWVYTEEYFQYDIDSYALYDFTITYKDGTVYTGDKWDIEDETGIEFDIDSDQSYDNQWGVGAHEVDIAFLGQTTTVTVNVIENPVASVTATQNGSLIEGIDGFLASDSIYDEDDNYIGETDDYFYYYINEEEFSYKVVYKDGRVFEGSYHDIYEATGYGIDIDAQQSYENQLKVGNNTVDVCFLGVTGKTQVKIIESPLDYVIVDDVTLIEYADGYWRYEEYWDENLGEWVVVDEYFHYYFTPSYTAVMKDGTKLTADYYGDIYYKDECYNIEYYLEQSYENPLGVGRHTAEAYFMGEKVTFDVNIVKTPVKSVKITPTRDVMLGIDGEDYYNYVEFNVEIEFKDGTKGTCRERDLYQKYGYSLDFDDVELISDYVSKGTFWFMGYEGNFQVTFIDNPYKSITISGENELKVSFNKPDGTSDVANVTGYLWGAGGPGYAEGGIITDKGLFEASITYTYDEEDEYPTQNITLTIGEMTSNTLENNNWLKAYELGTDYLSVVGSYREYCKHFYDREFTGIDVTTSNYNVTDLAYFAIFAFGPEYDYSVGENYDYLVFNADDVAEMIARTFNITNVDVRKHAGYDASTNTITIPLWDKGSNDYILIDCVNYVNGKWHFSRPSILSTTGENTTIEIIANDDLLIEKISISAKKLNGWTLENGKWAYYQNGVKVTNKWMKDSQGWCYLGSDGYCVTNNWVADSKGWCYLDFNGRMVYENWVQDDGKWYYLDGNGYMVSNTWKKDSIGWCYLGSSGAMLTNTWVRDSVGWCYVGADGYCVKNCWKQDSVGWCYLDSNGRMATNKWIKDSVGWCYVGANGYCVTNNWVKDSKGWCYMDENGRMTYSKWIPSGGKWYYIDENGYMVTGTKKIGGKTYKFASNGVWIP